MRPGLSQPLVGLQANHVTAPVPRRSRRSAWSVLLWRSWFWRSRTGCSALEACRPVHFAGPPGRALMPRRWLRDRRQSADRPGMAGMAIERNEVVTSCNIRFDETGNVQAGARQTRVSGAVVVPIRDSAGNAVGALGIGVHREHDYSGAEVARLLEEARPPACPPDSEGRRRWARCNRPSAHSQSPSARLCALNLTAAGAPRSAFRMPWQRQKRTL